MKLREKTRSVAIVAAVVIAFALGGMSTATAAGLTTGTVKKIAAKVIKKQAPTLSVAHASTADTATAATTATTATTAATATSATTAATAATLGGATAAQLKTTGYSYVLPAEPTAGTKTYTFPGLPVGTFLASYSFTAITSSNGTLQCAIEVSVGGVQAAGSYSTGNGGVFQRASATAFMTTTSTTDMFCQITTGTFEMVAPSGTVNVVSFIPIDVPISGTATHRPAG